MNNNRTTSQTMNTTYHETQNGGKPMNSWSIAGIIIGVVIIIAVAAVILCLWKYRKIKLNCVQTLRKRRSSTSHRPLEPDDTGSVDLPEPKTERQLFSIADNEDVEAGIDDYFYDEIFDHSEFEDEATNASLKHLYSVQRDDVPDLLFRDPKK